MAASLGAAGSVNHNGSGPSTLSFAGWTLMSEQQPVVGSAQSALAHQVKRLFVNAGMDTRVASDEADMSDTVYAENICLCQNFFFFF